VGSQHKKKKGTDDTRIIIADIKRDADQDFTQAALQPTYEGNAYIDQSRSMIDFVNVTESIDPSQTGGGGTDTIPPGQVTGLAATAISDTVISLNWTANTEPDLNNYDVYRGTVSGFTVTLGVTVPTGSPTSNAYSDTGRTASTTYYYKVGAVDFSSNRGPVSLEASATTLPPGTFLPSLQLHFDGDFADTSPNVFTVSWLFAPGTNGYTTGQFGSSLQMNTPVTPVTTTKDALFIDNAAALTMNTEIGFTFSGWVYPTDLTVASGYRRFIIEKRDDLNNTWHLSLDSAGILYFQVTKADITYKRQISGFVLNLWQHIGAVFNGVTNTVEVYRNGVAGVSSTAADSTGIKNQTNIVIGCRDNSGDSTVASSTYYEGRLDELRYYQKVLTSTQINNLKNTNAP
jgi:hypothetical protein